MLNCTYFITQSVKRAKCIAADILKERRILCGSTFSELKY
jgi:hypothetical protein